MPSEGGGYNTPKTPPPTVTSRETADLPLQDKMKDAIRVTHPLYPDQFCRRSFLSPLSNTLWFNQARYFAVLWLGRISGKYI